MGSTVTEFKMTRYVLIAVLAIASGCVARVASHGDVAHDGQVNEVRPTNIERREHDPWGEFEPDVSSVSGAKERECLLLIHECPRPGDNGNPIDLVRAVNSLIPLGTAKAIAILRRYSELAADQSPRIPEDYPCRIFSVARLAFLPKSPSASLRGGAIGYFHTVVKEDSANWPCYPFVLFDGIPFDVSFGLSLSGMAEPPGMYLDYLSANAVLRSDRLVPADNPLAAADRVFESAAWADILFQGDRPNHKWKMDGGWMKMLVRRQAVHAVSSLYDPAEDIRYAYSHTHEYRWDRHTEAVVALRPRWDTGLSSYVNG
jgi:hypothetical protein